MSKAEYKTEDVMFNIQHYSLHDGPGIRAAPFSKGCPLSCKWHSNSESQRRSPELLSKKNDCIHRGKCIDTCSQQALSTTSTWLIDRDRCIQRGKCTGICLTRALEMKGKRMSVAAVMCELEREEDLYRRSGGGITLSGGEPLAQPELAREPFKVCKVRGWHTVIETSGFTTKAVIDEVLPYVDPVLTDTRAIDPKIRERNIGANNRVILENLLRISFLTKMVMCIPVAPRMNDNSREIHNIVEFVRLMQNVDIIHLLPYHNFGEDKYNLLSRQYPMSGTKSIEEAQAAESKAMAESLGSNCHTGGQQRT